MNRRPWLVAVLLSVPVLLGGATPPAQEAQTELNAVLYNKPRTKIAEYRAACATGKSGSWQQMLKASGFNTPSPGAWCVTVLTRAGRDGTLGYVSDPNNSAGSASSFAFDSGFVSGYSKHEAPPVDAPVMALLLPIADRCLQQGEPNIKLCSAAGFMLGLRAAGGEVVRLR